MGEENKEEEGKKEEGGTEANKEEEIKKEEEEKKKAAEEADQEIVLKVDMHCEACARKVGRALKGFQGVEGVMTDYTSHKVVVKGKAADPMKVCERVQKKSGRKVELISPLPKPPEEEKKEESQDKKQEDNKADEPPPVITVTLKVHMHCEACAQVLQKRIKKLPGVESVATDVANNQVMVKGVLLDPAKLVESVYKRTRKQASIVEEEKKEEEKKEEEKKEEEKKEDKGEDKKEGEEAGKGEDDNKTDAKKFEYWPPKYYMEYYAYPPQIFSDENPNACSVM